MPELPDLTVFAENLTASYKNATILSVYVSAPKPLGAASAEAFQKALRGNTLLSVQRRGKQLVFSFSNGSFLWIHLMLHGEIYPVAAGGETPRYACVTIHFQDKRALAVCDRTQWMKVALVDSPKAPPWASSGIDPLWPDFTVQKLHELVSRQKRANIKTLLMNQRYIGGIGNAFSDEILWEAGILPLRIPSSLTAGEIQKLHAAIQQILKRAMNEIRRGIQGGFTGEIRDFLAIHGRKNAACPRCQSPVQFQLLGGRGTYFCTTCQT